MEDFEIFSAHSKCLHRLYFWIVFCAMYQFFWSHVYQKPCQRHNGPPRQGLSTKKPHKRGTKKLTLSIDKKSCSLWPNYEKFSSSYCQAVSCQQTLVNAVFNINSSNRNNFKFWVMNQISKAGVSHWHGQTIIGLGPDKNTAKLPAKSAIVWSFLSFFFVTFRLLTRLTGVIALCYIPPLRRQRNKVLSVC